MHASVHKDIFTQKYIETRIRKCILTKKNIHIYNACIHKFMLTKKNMYYCRWACNFCGNISTSEELKGANGLEHKDLKDAVVEYVEVYMCVCVYV